MAEFNGTPGESATFDQLETLLGEQWYRLADWRVAADEINYRRFFDINDLAAIRVENPRVFDEVHCLIRDLVSQNVGSALCVDHPDGLLDPQEYFDQLQQLCHKARQQGGLPTNDASSLYIVAEKILTGDEELPSEWKVAGTTGYDLLNAISRVLVDEQGVTSLAQLFARVTESNATAGDVIYESKLRVLQDSMFSELHMLAAELYRISQQSRHFRDFTFPSLLRALLEIIACFPVYRTYLRAKGWEVSAEDHGRITAAIRLAKRRHPTVSCLVFDFIQTVLMLEFPPTLTKPDRERWRQFALKFQQVTGPVTAKGVEDTAFYRYFPLASLNDVGGGSENKRYDLSHFHRRMQRRYSDWPHSMSATINP